MDEGSSTKVTRSFLLGRSMGDAVTQERELTISELILHGLPFAALATKKSRSIHEFLQLRDDMSRKRLDGAQESVALLVKRRILSSLGEEERGH